MTAAWPDIEHGRPYTGIPFAEYRSWPCMSQSVLKEGRDCMRMLKYRMENSITPTDDMLLGTALHCAFLEPEEMLDRVVLWEGKTRRGKVWDAFQEEHAGSIILTNGYYQKLRGMVKALREDEDAREWVHRPGHIEVSIVGEIDGLLFKGRVDKLTDDPIVDLKKTRSNKPWLFQRQIQEYGYDIQGWIYCTLFDRDEWVLLTVEDQPPYMVVPFQFTRKMLESAGVEARALIKEYQSCVKTGIWPGRSAGPIPYGSIPVSIS